MIEARILSSLFSVLMYMRPQDPHLPRYAERLMLLLDADLEVNQTVLMGAHLINYYTHSVGDLSTCDRIDMRITPLLASPQITVVTQLLWRSFCALPYILKGQDDAAYELVRPLPGLVKDNNLPFMEPIAIFYVVLVHLCRDDTRAAQPLLERMTKVVNTAQPADVAWLYLANCWYALARGDCATAFNQGRASLQAISRVGAALTEMDVNCLMALERCQSGKYDEALAGLAILREQGLGSSPRLRHQVLLVEVYAYLRKGEQAECHHRLREAFAIGRKHHFFGRLYCWFPKKAGIEIDYTQSLILKRRLLPEDLNMENWPWLIRIYTLGRFRLVINGQPHSLESRAQYKPLKLLKAVVALGGKDVKEEKLSEILWPDADGDAAHSAFTTTLSRLRKLVGDETITVKFGRVSLNKLRCWVDAWSFEDILDQLQKVGTGAEGLRTLAGKLITLYRGPFMADEEGVWSEMLRQRLQSKYFRFITHYGHALTAACGAGEQAGSQPGAGLDSGIEIDDLYCSLMASYSASTSTDGVEALAAYARLRENVSSEHGMTSSGE